MSRSRYSCTIAKTGGHVPRYAVRIGRRESDMRAEGLDVRCVDPATGVYALGPRFLG